jgi:hypothetical protein
MTVGMDPGMCTANVSYSLPSTYDSCGGSLSLRSGPAPGGVFAKGTTLVSYRVTDPANRTANCSFTVTVQDRESPKLGSTLSVFTPYLQSYNINFHINLWVPYIYILFLFYSKLII